jgi:hypothetical protein
MVPVLVESSRLVLQVDEVEAMWQGSLRDYEARQCKPHPYEKRMKEACVENEGKYVGCL